MSAPSDLKAALDEAEQRLERLQAAVAEGRAQAKVLYPAEYVVQVLRRRVASHAGDQPDDAGGIADPDAQAV